MCKSCKKALLLHWKYKLEAVDSKYATTFYSVTNLGHFLREVAKYRVSKKVLHNTNFAQQFRKKIEKKNSGKIVKKKKNFVDFQASKKNLKKFTNFFLIF